MPDEVILTEAIVDFGDYRKRYARVEVRPDGVDVIGAGPSRAIGRDGIRSAWIDAPTGDARLVLLLSDGTELAIGAEVARLRRALDLLGLGAGQRSLEVRLGSVRAQVVGVAAFLTALAGVTTFVGGGGLPVTVAPFVILGSLLFGAAAALATPRTTLAVGADGIAVAIRRQRLFVSYDDLEEVRIHKSGFEIERVDGHVITVRIFISSEQRTALEERIDSAMSGRPPASTAEIAARVSRRGRPLAEWRTAVRALLDGGVFSYRSRPVSVKELDALARDGAASLEERVGAALALATRLPGGRETIGAMAAASADETVRRALHAIAADTLDDRLLAELLGPPAPAPLPGRSAGDG